MLAYRLFDDGPRLVPDAPVPEPRNGEVLVKVAGAGACHSDLHVIAATAAGNSFFKPPFTLGHENTGWVAAVGPGVQGLEVGESVGIYCAWGCGKCRSCLRGEENYCTNQKVLRGCGLGADGGMAEYVLVPAARYLIPLGDLEPREAAPLTDAGITPYHAINRSRDLLRPGATCVVIGIGGLGHLALQILRATTGARIIALDVADEKLATAKALGADATVRSDGNAIANTLEVNRGEPPDVVLDFVGLQATIDIGRKLVRPGGDYTIVGLGGGTLTYGQGRIAWGARVFTPFYGSINELRELLALAAAGKVRAHVTRYPLERVADAYRALHDGTIEGRAVICPNG
ncbi:MAG TPA: NAD(P)-dependent alcohol dehydrogenase [Candidatus Acidoferrales bacterium]|nr:NAD(P)-dependent alcohol dehydrogenase [Candidatus Acidoferrales bacterium]